MPTSSCSLRRAGALLAALALGAASAPAAAQTSPSTSGSQPIAGTAPGRMPSGNDPRPIAQAAARGGPVAIDGRIDDAAWAAAPAVTNFMQQTPEEGRAPTERTELRFLYDASALYVAARMFDAQGAAGVRSVLARRDQLINGNLPSDKIAIVLDPFSDKNTRVWFELNPLGVKGDMLNGDTSFDPVWEGAAHVDSSGWTAEFRIPLSQLRFPRDSVQAWGMQVWRTISRRNESDMWAFWRLNEAGGPPFFGSLRGLALASQPRQLEFMPYVVTGQRFAPVADGDPFRRRSTNTTRVGADLKVNLTSNLTLDATINPDFGQVEVDPAVVNLSAYEVFFQERRPFFVANASAFSFGTFKCFFCSNVSSLSVFYSRRIGRTPQLTGVVDGRADYLDAPDASTILGAAKITGRTRNGWTVGILDALTDKESARYVPAGQAPLSSSFRSAEVEPLTNYFMGRLRKDLRGGNTRLGGIATVTNRALGSDTVARTRLRGDAEAFGMDLAHFWKSRTYAFDAMAVVSRVAGDTAAIRRTQQSSAHFYQRPGRTVTGDGLFDASYDPARTHLEGYGLYAHLAKESGDWMWEIGTNWRSPGFEVNDIAFLSRADYKWTNANLVRQWTKPTKYYRSIFTIVGGQTQYNYDGDRTDLQMQAFAQTTLTNFYNVSAFYIRRPRTYDDRLTRGGPTVIRSGFDYYQASVSTDSRKLVTGELDASVGRSLENEGRSASISTGIAIRPSTNMLLRLSPNWSMDRTVQQYVTAVGDPTATSFAGTRYVFGRLDQRTLSLETRLNTTFTPTLTLELYAQPFLSSGRYDQFKEFAAPRTIDMRTYGVDAGTIQAERGTDGVVTRYRIDPDGTGPAATFNVGNPDFNFRSLRGTAVMRWEYRPGATLFVVWTQSREGSASYGNFDFARERAALFRERPTNIFQVKVNYWIGR
jgi:hypothetical protein